MSLTKVKNVFGGAEIPPAIEAIKELQGLRTNVVAGAGANAKIDLADIREEDTLVSVIEYSSGVPVDKTDATTISSTKAAGTLTLASVVATDVAEVNGKEFTFVAGNPDKVKLQVLKGTTDDESAANLATEINRHVGDVVKATSAAGVVTITAVADGPTGNAVTISSDDTTITASGATLTGGTNTGGISISDSTTGNSLVVQWFDKK